MALVLGTSLSPLAGGVVTRHIGWHAGFLMLACAAFVMAVACYAWLPETRSASANTHSFGVLWRESRAVVAKSAFIGYVAAALVWRFWSRSRWQQRHRMRG